jgi:hypothetical protein
MSMRLGELIRQLEATKEAGATDESPIIFEGHDEDDNFIQAFIESVTTERRCEDDDEPQGVYLNLVELSID